MNMCTSFSSLIYKLNSSKWLAFPLHRQYYKSLTVQSDFTPTNNDTTSQTNSFDKVEQNPLEKILNTVPPESEALSPSDTLNIFRNLSETLKKRPQISTATYNVIDHRNFAILRQAMKVSMPYFRPNEKLDVLNAIQTLSIPVDDDVFNAVLSSLLENVFNMSLNEVMILDQVLISRQKNRLALELHRNLIDRFNTRTSQLPIGFSYFMRTRRMLQFIERNRDEIIDEVFVNMNKCAAKKQQIDILTAYEAMDIIITLSSFGDKCEYFRTVLDKAFDIWCTSEVTIQMAEIVITFLVRRKPILNHRLFNDPRFIETCAQVAIANGDIAKCFLILRHLNRLEFTSKRLIDFLLEYMKEEKKHTGFVHNCVSICIACDIGNHKPPLFDDYLYPLLASMNFHQQFDIRLNWPKFALRLHRLGIYHKPLINEIFKQKSQFDADGLADLESLQMEKLVNLKDMGSKLPDLKRILGENQLRLLVHADNGVVIPLLIKIDIHSKEFVSFGDGETNSLRSIRCDGDQCLVAIVRSSCQDVRPFRPDVITIMLDSSEWATILQHRTEQTLFTEIHDRVQSQKLKLDETNLL